MLPVKFCEEGVVGGGQAVLCVSMSFLTEDLAAVMLSVNSCEKGVVEGGATRAMCVYGCTHSELSPHV